MPELPEVETIVRRLRPELVGRSIKKIVLKLPKSLIGSAAQVTNRQIANVSRRAKLVRISFDNQMEMLIHLKMTGQLILITGSQRMGGGHPTDDWTQNLPAKHTRLWFELDSGAVLYFNDQRTFGWCQILTKPDADAYLQRFGPDVVDQSLTVDKFSQLFLPRATAIKQLLLDSSLVAGIGNIYACDALWEARINPWLAGQQLTTERLSQLLTSVRQVIQDGIDHQGATISHYRQADGLSGSYQDVRRVYARENEACQRCGQSIRRAKQGGRSTFWCDECQQN